MKVGPDPARIGTFEMLCSLCEQTILIEVICRAEGEQIACVPCFDNVWAHRFIHEERGELERLTDIPD